MISTDCFYTSCQRPKKNSQDFVLCGLEPIPYTILCDGCSSSRNTDVGARLLAFAAKSKVKEFLFPELERRGVITEDLVKEFGILSINRALGATSVMHMSYECLDSTLILAFVWEKQVFVFMYGDGCIFNLDRDGNLRSKRISFESSAPYYLSYYLDKVKNESYKKFADQFQGFAKKIRFSTEVSHNTKEEHYRQLPYYSFSCEKHSLVLITSDGVESFIDFNSVEKVDYEVIAKQLSEIKSKKGEFIKRRSVRMIEDLAKQNIFNTDDFSVAGILIEEE